MVKYFTADYIFPITSEPIPHGVVSVNEHGEVVALMNNKDSVPDGEPLEVLSGVIVPGFVNSHCHLELSYLHQKIAPHGGLVPFVKKVIAAKKVMPSPDNLLETLEQADRTMYENGIVAAGDIVNTSATAEIKKKSAIYYHTYVELIGFASADARTIMDNGLKLLAEFEPLSASITPHAPYSVSKELFKLIKRLCQGTSNLLTMHNQESDEENKFFRYKKGELLDLYEFLGQNIDHFKPQARNSVQTVIPLIDQNTPLLLVHNTYTGLKDVSFIKRFGRNITWCLCPNANLFIEGRLPKIDILDASGFDITVGTDSLASNNELSILSELKTVQQYFPHIALAQLLRWATYNGAKFLQIHDKFGSIETGKKPGLNLITNIQDLQLTPKSRVKRLI